MATAPLLQNQAPNFGPFPPPWPGGPSPASPAIATSWPLSSPAAAAPSLTPLPPPNLAAPWVYNRYPFAHTAPPVRRAIPSIPSTPPMARTIPPMPPAAQAMPQPATPPRQTPPQQPKPPETPPAANSNVESKALSKTKDSEFNEAARKALNKELESPEEAVRSKAGMKLLNILQRKPALVEDADNLKFINAFLIKILNDPSELVRTSGELILQCGLVPKPSEEVGQILQRRARQNDPLTHEDDVAANILDSIAHGFPDATPPSYEEATKPPPDYTEKPEGGAPVQTKELKPAEPTPGTPPAGVMPPSAPQTPAAPTAKPDVQAAAIPASSATIPSQWPPASVAAINGRFTGQPIGGNNGFPISTGYPMAAASYSNASFPARNGERLNQVSPANVYAPVYPQRTPALNMREGGIS